MTTKLESQITRLRRMGKGYGSIADELGVSLNTVKSFCRRKGLTGRVSEGGVVRCAFCGAEVPQAEHRKPKKYCSDACRMKWWNAHRHLLHRRTGVVFHCLSCGREFTDYASAGRKYCSHACYIKDRFGGGIDE